MGPAAVLVALVLAAEPPRPALPSAVASSPPQLTGVAALVAGGLLQVTSAALHVGADTLMRDTCGLDQQSVQRAHFSASDPAQAEREIVKIGGLSIACLAVADETIRLRVGAGIAAAASLSLVTAGGFLLGRSDAFHDIALRRRGRRAEPWTLEVVGATMLGAAAATWLGTRIAMATHRTRCRSIDCFATYDLVTLQTSATVGIVGAGMLAWARSYRRRTKLLEALAAAPAVAVAPQGLSFTLRGRF